MSRKVPCREQRKGGQETKGCLEDSREGGICGETLMRALSQCLSASPWKERFLFVLVAVRPLWIPGHYWSLAQEDWSITSRSSLAPCHGVLRWRVMPQGHSQSPHTRRISRANLSLPLSLTALSFMFCSQYLVLYDLHHNDINYPVPAQAYMLKMRGEPWGVVLNRNLQEPLGCCWEEAALCRPSRTIAEAAEPWAWPEPPTRGTIWE